MILSAFVVRLGLFITDVMTFKVVEKVLVVGMQLVHNCHNPRFYKSISILEILMTVSVSPVIILSNPKQTYG